jgi:hypothetical protein
LLAGYLEKGATIMANCYVAILNKMKQQLVSKCRGKLSKEILSLQDNAVLHKVVITSQKHPDLAPSDLLPLS